MTTTRTPVVFIHGLWLHATSWEPWVELFTEAGYAPVAPGWPGDARHGRSQPAPTRTASPATASTTSPSTTPASSTSCRPGRS